jgi:hypothetical protein
MSGFSLEDWDTHSMSLRGRPCMDENELPDEVIKSGPRLVCPSCAIRGRRTGIPVKSGFVSATMTNALARKLLIPMHGEMSEWLKEHGWKAVRSATCKRLCAVAVSDGRTVPEKLYFAALPRCCSNHCISAA